MENVIEIINEYNMREKVRVLNYFKLKNNDARYIIYEDFGPSSVKKIYAAQIEESKDELLLLSIDDEEILKLINEIMEKKYGKY